MEHQNLHARAFRLGACGALAQSSCVGDALEHGGGASFLPVESCVDFMMLSTFKPALRHGFERAASDSLCSDAQFYINLRVY